MSDENTKSLESEESSRTNEGPGNFIRELIAEDTAAGKHGGRVMTRFPPEPNGYLHIGHAKSICLNFQMAEEFGGVCNLRFDDTNPITEEAEYVNSMREDIRWLGFEWGDNEYFASDYFQQLYDYAVQLVKDGKAYVCSLTAEQIREYRGNFYKPGRDSPDRDRPVQESLDLLDRMRRGEFPDGSYTLRAKIDMQSPNMNLRDPPMYRILHATHHRSGDDWCIYPMYDFAHGLSDAIEGVTHSLCTLEFEDHRPLYDWFIEELQTPNRPVQTEFARLNIGYTVLSKRRLLQLVREGHVSGWDDPRMPTLRGMRRRGYTPEAIRALCERVGVERRDGVVDVRLFEHLLRDDLNRRAPRVMAVLRPLKMVILNYPEDETETFDAPYHPEDPSFGSRQVPFSREIYIERDDFREDPPKKWFRLGPGREIRLRYACLVTCVDYKKDPDTGEITEVHCTWDPDSRGGDAPDGRRVRGTSHWVCANGSVPAQVRLYDRLFLKENPLEDGDEWKQNLNPSSLDVLEDCRIEPSLATAEPGSLYQFERLGYFCTDVKDSTPRHPVFNRTIGLRDSWQALEKKLKQK